jgi:uncharacterized protein YaaR (DUF327 family)
MRNELFTVLLLGALLVGATTWAQPGGPSQPDESAEAKEEELEDMSAAGRNLVDEDIDSLSGQQKIERAEEKIQTSKTNLEETNGLLKKAREEERDIQKINCINDKLAAIKGFLKVAEQSYVKLKSAVSSGDTEESSHHYTLISVSNQKIDQLTEEARLCAGEVERYAEGTKVEVDVDDDVADPPPYLPGPGPLATLPELTPFQ